MKKQEKNEKTQVLTERGWYKEKIVEMIGQIENERFLKAIYISMSDYLKENEPD